MRISLFLCHLVALVVVSVTITAVVMAIASTPLHHYSVNSSSSSYAPLGTWHVPVLSTFCQELTYVVGKNDAGYNTTFYTLSTPPQLTGREQIFIPTISEQQGRPGYIISGTEVSFHLYMYPGSSFTMTVCIASTSSGAFEYGNASFYLIKGKDNFDIWDDRWFDGTDLQSDRYYNITTLCSSGNEVHTHPIDSEGDYYLVFTPMEPLEQHIFCNLSVVSMNLNLTRYGPPIRESIASSCSESDNNTCSVGMSIGDVAYLSIWPPHNATEWEWDKIDQDIALIVNCTPRYWMYSAIGLGIMLVVFPLVAMVCACCYKKRVASLEEREKSEAMLADMHRRRYDAPYIPPAHRHQETTRIVQREAKHVSNYGSDDVIGVVNIQAVLIRRGD